MMMQHALFPELSGAHFSPCRTWRYALWRVWGKDSLASSCAFIGLNPSTADEKLDDPTVRRCIRFAHAWGYEGLVMLNAYGFRATQPRAMKAAADPIGPNNNSHLEVYGRNVACVVAAWGIHCSDERAAAVCRIINRPIYCLGQTKSGAPKHPLYLPASVERKPYFTPDGKGIE